jgi:negative regulator of flagellin synthesis FlgM
MVDAIGPKPVSGARSINAVTQTSAVSGAPAVSTADENATTVTALAAQAASAAPVDLDRVAEIKHAIANGNFPIYPAKVADRLIALKLDWNPHEQA